MQLILTKHFNRKAKLIAISNRINTELIDYDYDLYFSELSLNLVKSLSYRTKLVGFVAMKSLLRFGDLFNFNLQTATADSTYSLIQNKNAKPVTVDFEIRDLKLRILLLEFREFEEIINYQMLSNEIKRYCRQTTILQDTDYKSNLHIFRHLESSFMFSRELPIALIAKKLGDVESTIRNSYIHKELLKHYS